MSQLSAIALYSGPITTLTAAGKQITLDPNLMQNPARKAMYIDEIRFLRLHDQYVNEEFGSYTYARLRVNRQNITADFVPIWSLCPSANIQINDNVNAAAYVYRPAKPIYVPQYTNLQCDLIVDPTAFGVCTSVNKGKVVFAVVYVGRQIDDVTMPPPANVDVPWAAKYISPTWITGALSAPAQSTANDLVNPFTQPLQISSMLSRTLYETGDAVITAPVLIQDLITLKMSNNKAAIITRDPTPIGHIFDMFSREVKLNSTLSPSMYFIATLQADMRDVDQAGNALTTIALHGYRTVTLSAYMS